MNARAESLMSILLAATAVAIGASLVHREFFKKPAVSTALQAAAPVKDTSFERARKTGVLIGSAAAAVQIVEFSDMECPSCRRFHEAFERVFEEQPHDVALTLVHFPLSQHRFAVPAARAAECAATRGRFHEFVRVVFAEQDSLGLKSWASYASTAGERDTIAFRRCANADSLPQRVASGLAIGREMQIAFTPTVLINGWRFNRTPTAEDLRQAITRVRAGNPPVDVAMPRN